jgi:hypothetical protein
LANVVAARPSTGTLAIMSAVPAKRTLIAAAATIAASIPLALMFVRTELRAAIASAPGMLVFVFGAGSVLALVGASLPSWLHWSPVRISRRSIQYVGGGAIGLAIGLLAALVGILASAFGLSALLVWFLVGSFIASTQQLLVGPEGSDG